MKKYIIGLFAFLFFGFTFGTNWFWSTFVKTSNPVANPETAFFSTGGCVANSSGSCSSTGKYWSGNRLMTIESGLITTFVPLQAKSITITNTGSINGLNVNGNINNYFQINVKNSNTGTSSSSDIVATMDIGTESTGYIDMGINGSKYTGSMIGRSGDTYLYSNSNDMYVGTYNAKNLYFIRSGATSMTVDGSGYVGIGTTGPTDKLTINGSLQMGELDQIKVGPRTKLNTSFLTSLGFNVNTSLIGGMDFKNSHSGGQVRLLARNDVNDYIVMSTAGSTNSNQFFGINGADQFLMFGNAVTDTNKQLTVGTYNAGNLNLGTNNLVRSTITSDGYTVVGGTAKNTIASTSQLQIKGIDDNTATTRTAITYGRGGFAAPSAVGSESSGDKLIFWNSTTTKGGIGMDSADFWFQIATSQPTRPHYTWFLGNTGTTQQYTAMSLNESGVAIGYNTTLATNALQVSGKVVLMNGNVGIGTASPTVKLDVNQADVSTNSLSLFSAQSSTTGLFTHYPHFTFVNTDTTVGNYTRIGFSDTANGSNLLAGIAMKATDHTSNYGDLTFYTRDSVGIQERLYIKSSGYVGIGTATPSVKLDVVGNINAYNLFLSNTGAGAVIGSNGGNIASWDDDLSYFSFADNTFHAWNNKLGIGTINPIASLHVSGDVIAGNYDGGNYMNVDSGGFTTWLGNGLARNDIQNLQLWDTDAAGEIASLTNISGSAVKTRCFDDNDAMYGSVEMPHDIFSGTVLRPHVHWMGNATSATTGTWWMDYTVLKANGSYLTSSIISVSIFGITGRNTRINNLDGSLTIPGLALGDTIAFKIYRTAADTYGANLMCLVQVGFHYQSDRRGSRTEYSN